MKSINGTYPFMLGPPVTVNVVCNLYCCSRSLGPHWSYSAESAVAIKSRTRDVSNANCIQYSTFTNVYILCIHNYWSSIGCTLSTVFVYIRLYCFVFINT